MARYYQDWPPYVPVAERRRKAARAVAALRKAGEPMAPVAITGRAIATTFWGRAWCDNMESYHDYASRLPRGRTYVRNGSVLDLQIARGRIAALVVGSELYRITITVREVARAQWRAICADCAGGIDSLIELLQGRLSEAVMQRLCRQEGGLFPRPPEIRFSCTCPDHAMLCKQVAAALYGVGSRLDHAPELLFRLRAVNEAELLGHVDQFPLSITAVSADKLLPAADVATLFGLDMAETAAPAGPGSKKDQRARPRRAVAKRRSPGATRPTKKAMERPRKASVKTTFRRPNSTAKGAATLPKTRARKDHAGARDGRPKRNASVRRRRRQ